MDIGLYQADRLLVCYEIKRPEEIQKIIPRIFTYEKEIDFNKPDRNNQALRKAKYIVKHKPEYFCVVTIGKRYEYQVSFPKGKAFRLTEDMVPWI
ncbi:unnamed protein product [marine sediment metagenome]|uniref:Uncharacterized protein n=1 Tax=marine sediment metagenome TaxID=412755 RepID=X1NL84_9ZZZZ